VVPLTFQKKKNFFSFKYFFFPGDFLFYDFSFPRVRRRYENNVIHFGGFVFVFLLILDEFKIRVA
jgi:hypothetical protein